MTSLNSYVDWCLVDGPNSEVLSSTDHPHHDIFLGLQPASSPPNLIDKMGFIMSPPYVELQIQEGPVTLQFGEVTPLGSAPDTHLCLPAAPPDGFGQSFLSNDGTSLTPQMTNLAASKAHNIQDAEPVTPRIGQRKQLSRNIEPWQGTQPLPESNRTTGTRTLDSRARYISKRKTHLENNRQAAKRCRKKVKSRNAALESEYKEQSAHNSQLLADISRLRSELLYLQNEILKHSQCRDDPLKRHLVLVMQRMPARDGCAT
ncbi:hypothetical protein MYU51_000037 [Penicillium brevicompactum]|uniref:uncharacterized protein n=1 Tax=Penicillium brevicompactum TaxID=5074 RepID=UPI0025412120|nr:uncharacterized protein N7506_005387 [Penicillium brevicompactum]KAJ5337365.1 hypothetical protein N7506_005387 [Penicillium brevicompactum]